MPRVSEWTLNADIMRLILNEAAVYSDSSDGLMAIRNKINEESLKNYADTRNFGTRSWEYISIQNARTWYGFSNINQMLIDL